MPLDDVDLRVLERIANALEKIAENMEIIAAK